MEFNRLPEDYDEAKLGPQKRRTEFESQEAKCLYDAKNLIEMAKKKYGRKNVTVRDALDLATREDDNLEILRRYIAVEIKGKGEGVSVGDRISPTAGQQVAAAQAEATEPETELSPEQIWLGEFKTRFDALSQLHEGIEWSAVERSLLADPESMKKLQALDEKGHQMNVFGEEGDEFIFASAWNRYEQVAADHRNIAYDPEGQALAEKKGRQPNGNAVSIIAKIMGVAEEEAVNYLADPEFHDQLRKVIAVNGWAWLKTDAATRKTGFAFDGGGFALLRRNADDCGDAGSFRAALRVKKA